MKKIILIYFVFIISNLFAQTGLSVEKINLHYEFYPKFIQGFRGMNDGIHFTKISKTDSGSCITKHLITDYNKTGEVLLNLSKLKYNNQSISVDDYTFNQDETKILLLTEKQAVYRRSYTAVYYIYDLNTKQLSKLSTTDEKQTQASFSQDGSKIAYSSNNNLFIKDLNSGKTTQITNDGKINQIINGTSDWVYEEEFSITKAFDWSPDSKYISYLKFDESKVKDFTMEYNVGQLYPTLYTFKYPKAGEANSLVTAYIYDLENQTTQQIDLGEYEYIPRISWSNINNTLVLQTLNRHQNHLKYHKVTLENSTWLDRIFYEEKNKTYIDIDDNLIFLKDGRSILRTSEKDAYKHIYKICFDGSEQQITKGNWDVIDFCGIDAKNKYIYYTAAKKGAIHKGIYKTDLNGKRDLAISSETGKNNANFTPGMRYFIKNYSNANTPPVFSLCDNDGKVIATMEDNSELVEKIKKHQFSPKEFIEFDMGDYSLNGWIIKPANFDVNKKYPVYVNIYGGPGSNMVYDGWDFNLPWHELLAQEGYVVVSVDPRGTMYRGKKFKDITYLQLGKYETQDFIHVAKQLQQLSYIDSTRIGIQGWSYGGFMAASCMTKGDGIFKMGIAIAPVTNWKYYDNIYTERFMRTPAENPEGYNANSPINFANDLQGKFFIIHGSGDDNVHVQNTLEMVNALIRANKQFDLFIYPNRTHGIYGGNTRNHLFQMVLDYVKENL